MKNLFCATLLVLLFGCKKPDDKPMQQASITTGQTGSMKELSMTGDSVDINHDGKTDAALRVEVVKLPASYAPRFKLACLSSDLEILAAPAGDTIFSSGQVSYGTYPQSASAHFYKRYDTVVSCARPSNPASFKISSALHFKTVAAGAAVPTDGHYASGTGLLTDPAHVETQSPTFANDTAYISSHNYIDNCHDVLVEGENYFPFRMRIAGLYRYGWLRVTKTGADLHLTQAALRF